MSGKIGLVEVLIFSQYLARGSVEMRPKMFLSVSSF